MRWYQTTLALLVCGCLLMATPAVHAGWGLPSLNPFSSNDNKPVGPKGPDDRWHMPSLPGFGGKAKNKSKPNEKSLLTKTKETVFPWTKKPASSPKLTGARSNSGYQSSFATRPRGPEKQSKSFFSSWFQSSNDEPQVPMAPHEWLGQPMPE